MAQYSFKAVRGNEHYEGVREAADKFLLYADIKREGGVIISAEEVKAKKSWNSLSLPSFLERIKASDKVMLAKNLGTMISAGLPLTRALSVIERQTRNTKFKKLIQELSDRVSKGETLSSAMTKRRDAFSELFISMVKAGEESGNLAKSLRSVGDQLEKSYLLTKKIRGAMIYPAIILLVMIGIAALMLMFVVPTLTDVFREMNVDLPISTKIVIFVSEFLKNNFLVAFSGFIVIVAGLIYWGKTGRGKRFYDALILHLPVISEIAKEVNSARTARTLSSLLSSGVDFLVAIRIAKDVVQNVFYKDIMDAAAAHVEKGKPISEILTAEEKFYPPFVGEMASIGEETGKLGEMFENVATFYENEVEQKTKDMSTIIEPFLMVFIGVAVAFFAVSMLSPIYSLVDTI